VFISSPAGWVDKGAGADDGRLIQYTKNIDSVGRDDRNWGSILLFTAGKQNTPFVVLSFWKSLL